MKSAFLLFIQLIILWLLNKAGYLIVEALHVPVPGNVVGMILLFLLLASGIFPLRWIEQASSFLIKHLAFFFIPIAVGLMNFGPFFAKNGIALIAALLVSTAAGLFITGFVSQTLARKKEAVHRGDSYHTV
ncbi:CidA/LrgA family protein [Aneurinibacillus tyrosinisolvens]|uniref:CidA/LrgA family protein n=1 Tax=Aneurinibacillus tyrosinisolvens TaxID=1443435 RepID=UPI00063F1949|nr:CidA/LrgA family protein [Aneurinibacillus tyrosinisolvens]